MLVHGPDNGVHQSHQGRLSHSCKSEQARKSSHIRIGQSQKTRLTFPRAMSPLSKKNRTPKKRNKKPRPVRPMPISAGRRKSLAHYRCISSFCFPHAIKLVV